MAKSKDRRLETAKHMPVLHKKQAGEEYDAQRDEVLQWVSKQPELVSFLVSKLADWGYIRFDPETRTWQGVDYGAD